MNERETKALVEQLVDAALRDHPAMQKLELMTFSDAFLGKRDYHRVITDMNDDQRRQMLKEVREYKERQRPLDRDDEARFVAFAEKNCKMRADEARELFRKSADHPSLRDCIFELRNPSAA